MKSFALVATTVAAAIAGGASAYSLDLGDNSLAGGESNSYTFFLGEGPLTSFSISFDYVDASASAWASDMILQITDPNGVSQFWGGFNVTPAGASDEGLWGFDGSGSSVSGHYEDTKSVDGLSGRGYWTFTIWNGWTGGPVGTEYNNFLVEVSGIPAPGAIALLGIAGLVSGRRRRA